MAGGVLDDRQEVRRREDILCQWIGVRILVDGLEFGRKTVKHYVELASRLEVNKVPAGGPGVGQGDGGRLQRLQLGGCDRGAIGGAESFGSQTTYVGWFSAVPMTSERSVM